MTDDGNDKQWHLDKRVPIALIFAIAVQTGTFLVWGATLTTRVEHLERQQLLSAPQSDRLTRVETRIEAIQEGIGEIKRLIQRPSSPP